MRTYSIKELEEAVKYLLKVEDRIPPGFYAGPRSFLSTVLKFFNQVAVWKGQGVSQVKMRHGPDPKLSLHQPYRRYYLWRNRLNTLRSAAPIKAKRL